MEKKFNKEKVAELEETSEEKLNAAKTTKNAEEKTAEQKENEAVFDKEITAMREDSGVNEILEKK